MESWGEYRAEGTEGGYVATEPETHTHTHSSVVTELIPCKQLILHPGYKNVYLVGNLMASNIGWALILVSLGATMEMTILLLLKERKALGFVFFFPPEREWY